MKKSGRESLLILSSLAKEGWLVGRRHANRREGCDAIKYLFCIYPRTRVIEIIVHRIQIIYNHVRFQAVTFSRLPIPSLIPTSALASSTRLQYIGLLPCLHMISAKHARLYKKHPSANLTLASLTLPSYSTSSIPTSIPPSVSHTSLIHSTFMTSLGEGN